jgi:hypothetical protein
MLSRTRATKPLLALSLGALLLTGLAPLTAGDATDEVAMVAQERRHTRIEAVRDRWEHRGDADAIYVDVNPTLPGQKFYRVVVKVKHDGRWTRCAPEPYFVHRGRVGRTFNMMDPEHARGRAPHEVTVFEACKHKANGKYRVIVPAQHGFARTVVKPHNP